MKIILNKNVIIIFMIILLLSLVACNNNHSKKVIFTDIVLDDIAWDGEHLWGVNMEKSRLVKLDINTSEILFNTELPIKCPQSICYSDDYFWITTCLGEIVKVSELGEYLETTKIPGLSIGSADIKGIVFAKGKLFILNGYNILELDRDTYEIINKFEFPRRIYSGLSFNGEELVLLNSIGKLMFINLEYGYVSVEKKIEKSGIPIGITWDGEKFLIPIYSKKRIIIVK
ncbi:hypothetical protein KAU33_06540 [Candidatus Dependentiae bacterium]|nr:hypothetical protein [Candidatus Dependentiae bacterium]